MTRPACVVIDRQAARANLARVRKLVPHRKIMAIIKADAYGHGLLRMAKPLADADAFGVACLEEAQILREAGIEQPIVLLEGPFSETELPEIQKLRLETVVHQEEQVRMLECLPPGRPIPVWIKVDTGMHRLGFAPGLIDVVWQRLSSCRPVVEPVRLMTHLACSHERNHPFVLAQLECFNAVTRSITAERSMANSAAILAWPDTHADWIRPGLMLYGVSPFNDSTAIEQGFSPVMSLRSALIAINFVRAGETIGYDGSWLCPEDRRVGVVALGYGDGYPRYAPSGTPVLVNGKRAVLIGRSSMDMLSIDLRGHPEAKIGDPVIFWGEDLPVEEIARWAGTIPYELLCGVARLRARYIDRA